MDLEFNEDQDELRQAARSFLTKECPPSMVRQVVEGGGTETVRALWSAMASLDWPGIAIGEEFGGLGLGFTEIAVLAEELGAVIAPGPFLPTVTQFAACIEMLGTGGQRRRFLEPVARSGSTGALAISDDARSWEIDQVVARATRANGTWTLSGTKKAVMAGPHVDNIVVICRADPVNGRLSTVQPGGPADVGAFVVAGSEIAVAPVRSIDPTRELCDITFDGVVVPDDCVLGEPGDPGVVAALSCVLDSSRAALALETVGTCRTLFELTLDHAGQRRQFGVPIGSFQALKHRLADLYVAMERARALCYHAVAAIAEDHPSRATAVAMAKAASDDCQRAMGAGAMQIFGGISFTWEHDLHLYVKRAQSSGALFGGALEHRASIARSLGVSGR